MVVLYNINIALKILPKINIAQHLCIHIDVRNTDSHKVSATPHPSCGYPLKTPMSLP